MYKPRGEKISIIVPVYNVKKFLNRCVNSLVNQTYQNLEIIVIDDGSTDGSEILCDQLAKTDSRIITIHKKNGGLSDARNTGINLSTGEYLFFVDGDDWLDKKALEILINLAATKKNIDIIECNYRDIYQEHQTITEKCTGKISEKTGAFALNERLKWGMFKTLACNKLYRRSLFDEIRFPLGKLHEDEFTTYKLFYKARKVIFLDIALYNYDRTRENSITAKFTPKNLDVCEAFYDKLLFYSKHKDLRKNIDLACMTYVHVLMMTLSRYTLSTQKDEERLQKVLFDARKTEDIIAQHNITKLQKKCFKLILQGRYQKSVKIWLRNGGEI